MKTMRTTRYALVAACGGALLLATTPAFAGPKHADREAMEAARGEAFAEADADTSGTLNAAEFEQFHNAMRRRMEAARFARLDADGDGELSLEEIVAGHPKGRHGPRPF